MRTSVLLRDPEGTVHELGPGDIVGRLWSAALQIDDPRVSEAHAMVSLRDGELRLLSLRALFAVGGRPLRELTLEPGQRIELARGLTLTVDEVVLPRSVLVLEMDGLGRQTLPNTSWLVLKPHPRLSSRPEEAAVAAFWWSGDGWRVRLGDGPAAPLVPGWEATIAGTPIRATLQELRRASEAATRAGGVEAPLRLVCHYDVVVIEREGAPGFKIAGNTARLLTELAEIGAPVEWEPVARGMWPQDSDDTNALRKRWDMALYRLRRKLANRSIRSDLVSSDGAGRVMLHLAARDELVLP